MATSKRKSPYYLVSFSPPFNIANFTSVVCVAFVTLIASSPCLQVAFLAFVAPVAPVAPVAFVAPVAPVAFLAPVAFVAFVAFLAPVAFIAPVANLPYF
ncbi:MAG: hypothetical protein U5Q03_07780 [Bacteroidota bacterium]|nr:hypothetical protein [Bacteroidota bacterium]